MAPTARSQRSVASLLSPLVERVLKGKPVVRMVFWDGSALGPEDARATAFFKSPNALSRLLYAPNELGLARAYVSGDIDIRGDIFEIFTQRDSFEDENGDADLSLGVGARLRIAAAARSLGVLRAPLPPPPEEARLRGRRHSLRRDRAAIAHHYDISNDFYRLFLGRTMTYSCAYFVSPEVGLDSAQRAKYDLVCRKLGLKPGMRLLDVGCGWGGMVMHAAEHYGVDAVGVTLSERQHDLATKRVADAGLSTQIEVRLQDYRDLSDEPFDAISSIGMFEHVGVPELGRYFGNLFELLLPGGRLLNHAISKPPGHARLQRRSFIARYVFPDGELQEVGAVATAMQANHFEVRDVESLREHYALTLRQWVANLEANWDAVVAAVGPARARIWRLYMAGSAFNFEAGRINVHQVLGVKPDRGASGMPLTRAHWLGASATADKGFL